MESTVLSPSFEKQLLYKKELNGKQLLSLVTFLSRYSRPDLGIFTYRDSVNNLLTYYRKAGYLSDDDVRVCVDKYASNYALFPSMRSVQFQPVGFLSRNERMFNCTGILIDKVDSIWHTFYLLLCGCGVGYNISRYHVSKLPLLVESINEHDVYKHDVEDSVLGWAQAARDLLYSYFSGNRLSGKHVVFDYSYITPKGVRLRSCGRPAPGPEPLKKSLELVRSFLNDLVMNRKQRRLNPIDVYDVICMLASSVMAGGVRRSAMIALFDQDDEQMLLAKTGNWYNKYPWRAFSNNSIIVTNKSLDNDGDYASRYNSDVYRKVLEVCLEYGEPGVIHIPDIDCVVNPCAEIVFRPKIDGVSSYQVCNLVEVCLSNVDSIVELYECVYYATKIGTIQYQFCDFICPIAKEIMRRHPLIGLSLTGLSSKVMRNSSGQWSVPDVYLMFFRDIAKASVEWNERLAKRYGCRPADRVTCIKPSGTVSCIAGSSSGVHPWYSSEYVRNINLCINEPAYQFYYMITGNEGTKSSMYDDVRVVGFPIKADSDFTWDNVSAVNMLGIIADMHRNWVCNGIGRYVAGAQRLSNAVSCTVLYDSKDIGELAESIYRYNVESLKNTGTFAFTGLSFLPRISSYPSMVMPFLPASSSKEAREYFDRLFTSISLSSSKYTYDDIVGILRKSVSQCGDNVCFEAEPINKCDNELCFIGNRT